MPDYKLVDPFLNMPKTPEEAKANRLDDPNMKRWFKDSRVLWEGATFEDMVANMDMAGIEKGIITASAGGDPSFGSVWSVGRSTTEEQFEAACARFFEARRVSGGRLQGCLSVDPTGMMTSVRRVEKAVREYGFNHIWMMPALVGLPANHRVYYPIYAKCAELGVPVKINAGFPGPLRFGTLQRTINLDEVCIAFPELTVVACHVGHPWHLETVAMLQKHANFYLVTSGFAPKHVPKEIFDVANRRVPHKLMWSSDYPVLPMERCAREGWEVPLKDEVKRRYLRENAIEVFKLG
jgi:predicted TIM-barrel fold metal-dependent hydrolase